MNLMILFLIPLNEKWSLIKTEHFDIYFYTSLNVAQYVSVIAESVYNEMKESFSEINFRTNIIISDNYDEGIIFSSPFREKIFITLANDDLYKTIKYGLTDVIIKRGFINFNYLLPDLITDGITGYDNSVYNGILKRKIIEDDFPSISDVLVSRKRRWPGEYSSRIFGEKFLDFLKEKYGEEKLNDFLILHSRLPMLNTWIKKVFGKSKEKLWDEFKEYLKEKYSCEIELKEGRKIKENIKWIKNLRYLRDGRILYVEDKNSNSEASIFVDKKKIYSGHINGSIALDNDKIYFVNLKNSKNYYLYGDVYSYNLITKRIKRLTHQMRVKYIDYDVKNERFICVVNSEGTDNIFIFDKNFENPEKITDNKHSFIHYYYPSFSPDGRYVAVTISGDVDFTDIYIIDLENKDFIRLTEDPSIELFPQWSPDGKYLVFSKDLDGIFNIYLFSIEKQRFYQITKTLSGALFPIFKNNNELMFAVIQKDNFSINEMEIEKEEIDFERKGKENGKREFKEYNISGYNPLKEFGLSSIKPFIEYSQIDTFLRYGCYLNFDDILNFTSFTLYFEPFLANDNGFIIGGFFRYNRDPMIGLNGVFYWDDESKKFSSIYAEIAYGGLRWGDKNKLYNFWIGISYNPTDTFPFLINNGMLFAPFFPLYSYKAFSPILNFHLRNYSEFPSSISKEKGINLDFSTNFYHFMTDIRIFYPEFKGSIIGERFLMGYLPHNDPFTYLRNINQILFLKKLTTYYDLSFYHTLEYRFPLLYPEKIIFNTPLYLEKIYGKFYCDFGGGWNSKEEEIPSLYLLLLLGHPEFSRFLFTPKFLGLEISADFNLFYKINLNARIGIGYSVSGKYYNIYLCTGNSF